MTQLVRHTRLLKLHRNGKEPAATSSREQQTSAHFESRRWQPLLLAVATVMALNPTKFIPPDSHVFNGMNGHSHGRGGDATGSATLAEALVSTMFAVFSLAAALNATQFPEDQLRVLEQQTIPHTMNALMNIHSIRQLTSGRVGDFGGVKLHLISHVPQFIRQYGAPANFDTATFETYHKTIKQAWSRGSKRAATLSRELLRQV